MKSNNNRTEWLLTYIFYALCAILGTMIGHIAFASCEDLNTQQFKQNIQDIQSIAKYPNSVYTHLQNEELNVIKKKSEFDESLKIYLKLN